MRRGDASSRAPAIPAAISGRTRSVSGSRRAARLSTHQGLEAGRPEGPSPPRSSIPGFFPAVPLALEMLLADGLSWFSVKTGRCSGGSAGLTSPPTLPYLLRREIRKLYPSPPLCEEKKRNEPP